MAGSMLPAGALEGKVAIVTGGATGLGKAMALEFGRLGARVVIASRKPENLDAAATEIRATGADVLTVAMDVRDPEAVERTVTTSVDRFGQIDILVNNAAGNFVCPAEDLSVNGWNAVINIVLNGSFYMSRAVGKQVIKQGHGGAMVNILATYAFNGGPGTIHSAAAKAGVLSMTRTLAVEWAKYGIRTNAIAPGPVDGTGAAAHLWPTEEARRWVLDDIPLGRFGEALEIANAAAYLVSDYGAFINGEVLTIDGGAWLNKGRFTGGDR